MDGYTEEPLSVWSVVGIKMIFWPCRTGTAPPSGHTPQLQHRDQERTSRPGLNRQDCEDYTLRESQKLVIDSRSFE